MFALLSEVQRKNENLAAIVLSILKISKDSIKRKNPLYLLKKILFTFLPQINWNIKLGEFRIELKYLAKWRGFAEGIIHIVLFTILCLKRPVKEHFNKVGDLLTKIFLYF